MGKWMKATVYATLTAAVLWWIDPAGREWSSILGNAALMVAPFRAIIALEDRIGCPLHRIGS